MAANVGDLASSRRICLLADLRVGDLVRLRVERAEGGERRDEHPHRVGVVVEPVDEALAHVLVDERVVRDVVRPLLELRLVRQLAVQEEVGDLDVRRGLGELLDRVAAVAQDAVVAVEVRDVGAAGRRRQVGRVVHEEAGIQLAQRRAREHTSGDGDRHRLPGAVIGDRDGVGHVEFPSSDAGRAIFWGFTGASPVRGASSPSRARYCGCRKATAATEGGGGRRAMRAPIAAVGTTAMANNVAVVHQ